MRVRKNSVMGLVLLHSWAVPSTLPQLLRPLSSKFSLVLLLIFLPSLLRQGLLSLLVLLVLLLLLHSLSLQSLGEVVELGLVELGGEGELTGEFGMRVRKKSVMRLDLFSSRADNIMFSFGKTGFLGVVQ